LKIETKRYAMERKASKRIADVSGQEETAVMRWAVATTADFAGRPGLNLAAGHRER
jgi:hypothetical protein